jgi:hypothetical protein
MVAFDITDLLRQRDGYENIDSAYMFAWEGNAYGADFDYNDAMWIMTNVTANNLSSNATPEPATALILGLALTAIPFARRLKQKRKKVQ